MQLGIMDAMVVFRAHEGPSYVDGSATTKGILASAGLCSNADR